MKEVCDTVYLLMLLFIGAPIFLGIVQLFSNSVKDDYAEKYSKRKR